MKYLIAHLSHQNNTHKNNNENNGENYISPSKQAIMLVLCALLHYDYNVNFLNVVHC